MMEAEWRAEGVLPRKGWSRLPREPWDQPTEWFQEECSRIRSWWGEEAWGPGVEEAVRGALVDAAKKSAEQGTLAVMLHWPLDLPVPTRVRILLGFGSPLDVSDWQGAGFEVDEYPGSKLGPGLKCLAVREESIGGEVLRLFTAVYSFASDTGSVLVTAEAGSKEIFEMTMASLPLLLSTLDVIEPDGSRFEADPVAMVTRNNVDEWEDISNA